jgi:hypothetical protein
MRLRLRLSILLAGRGKLPWQEALPRNVPAIILNETRTCFLDNVPLQNSFRTTPRLQIESEKKAEELSLVTARQGQLITTHRLRPRRRRRPRRSLHILWPLLPNDCAKGWWGTEKSSKQIRAFHHSRWRHGASSGS